MLEWTTTECAGRFLNFGTGKFTYAWQVDLSCGLDNELLTVTELEKCEYLITGTTPALCIPLESERNVKDEL